MSILSLGVQFLIPNSSFLISKQDLRRRLLQLLPLEAEHRLEGAVNLHRAVHQDEAAPDGPGLLRQGEKAGTGDLGRVDHLAQQCPPREVWGLPQRRARWRPPLANAAAVSMHSTMPLDQSLGFLATRLMEAAATRPWAMAESSPPNAMGRQATKYCSPWATVSTGRVPACSPMRNTAKNHTTRPYRPWVPGITWRIITLPNLQGSWHSSPVPASPAMPVPLADPMPLSTAARPAPSRARARPPNRRMPERIQYLIPPHSSFI